MNIQDPEPHLVQQPIPVAPRISIVNTIEAQHLRTYKEENPELYDILNDAYKQNLPSYTTYINVFGREEKYYGSMYEHVNRIKENLTTEQYSQIVDEFNDKYINKNVLTALENNSYAQMIEQLPYLQGMITGFELHNNDGYDSFRKHAYTPRMVVAAPDTNVDSITNDLERMSLKNEDPYGTYALYINILVELSKEFTKKNSNTVRFGGGNYMVHNLESLYHIQLIGIFILCDHYFDKIEFLFQKYASSKKTQKMLEDRIDFYNGLIEGRNDKMKRGFFSTVPLLFDLKYTTKSSIAYENEVDIRDRFFRKDLLYMRLKKAKQDKADFEKSKKVNKLLEKAVLLQSKYIPIIMNIKNSDIMVGIIRAARDDVRHADALAENASVAAQDGDEDGYGDAAQELSQLLSNSAFLSNTDLTNEVRDIKLNAPRENLLDFVFKLDDDTIEKYFEKWLKTCNRASLKKVFKTLNDKKQYTELYNTPKGTNNDWVEELVSLFEIRASQIADSSEKRVQLPKENLDLIYQFAHKYYGGYRKKRNKNIKLKYKGGTLSDYLQKSNEKKQSLLSQIDTIQASNAAKDAIDKEAAKAAQDAINIEKNLMPPPFPVIMPPPFPVKKPPILVKKKTSEPLIHSLPQGTNLPMLPKIEGGTKNNNIHLQKGGVIYVDNEDDQDDFYCPITLEIMEEPTLAEDGFSYERENIEDWFIRKKSNNEPITSPKTGEVMGDKLFPNTTLKNIIQNTRFDREPTSDIHTQTEEKQVDSTQVQTEEKQVDSIDVQTPESIIDETLTENALEIVDKVSDNMIDEYIGEEMLKTRKSKARDKKKRQKKGKKERDRIEKDKALAEEAIANAMNAMAYQTITEEKDLFYSVDWEQLMNKIGLTKDGNLDEVNSDDIFADFYIVHAEIYAFKYFVKNPGATIKDLMKEKIPHLIHKEAYQIESLFTPDGMIDNDSIKKEIKEWLENIIEIQERLLKAGMWEDGARLKRFIKEKNRNDSLRKDYNDYKKYKDTERHILNTRKALLSVEMDKKYLGAATKTNNKGEEIGISLFTTSNTTIEQKFQGLFLFWLNCISLTAKMSLQEIKEFVNSPFYGMTVIQMHQLNEKLPIEQWTFEMVRRGLRVGYICGAAIIAAWVRRLHDFKNNKNKKDEQILKLGKWWSEMESHVGDGAQKEATSSSTATPAAQEPFFDAPPPTRARGTHTSNFWDRQKEGVKQKRLKYYPPGFS